MSYQDARGHTVPAGTDQASRQSLLDLSLSIPSIYTCSSAAAAAQYVAALEEAGITPATESPAFVMRTDLSGMLTSWDGSQWTRHGGGFLTATSNIVKSEQVFSSAGGPVGIATLTFTLPARSAVRLRATARIRPAGNAAGSIGIYQSNVSGTQRGAASWHSQSSTSHQWPVCDVTVWLTAGSWAFVLGVQTSTGSVAATYDLPTMSAAYA